MLSGVTCEEKASDNRSNSCLKDKSPEIIQQRPTDTWTGHLGFDVTRSNMNFYQNDTLQFRFLSTRRPAAGSATTTFFGGAVEARGPAFFVEPALGAPLRAVAVGSFLVVVAVTVVVLAPLPTAFFAVTTVVPVLELLAALEFDIALAVRSCAICGAGGGAMGPFFALAFAVAPVVGEILRAAVRVLLFACSTMPARLAVMALVAADVAVFNGLAGFKGEAGRAM